MVSSFPSIWRRPALVRMDEAKEISAQPSLLLRQANIFKYSTHFSKWKREFYEYSIRRLTPLKS